MKRLKMKKITKKITEKPPNITENLDSKDLSKICYIAVEEKDTQF